MIEVQRSPSEYYIRYLISTDPPTEEERDAPADEEDDFDSPSWSPDEIIRHLESAGLESVSPSYIRSLRNSMLPFPEGYDPKAGEDKGTRRWLKHHRIYDLWNPNPGVREALLILNDRYLREKMEPLLLSSLTPVHLARRLRKYTSICLTAEGVSAFSHYFWNRKLLTQHQWVEYARTRHNYNVYLQSLTAPADLVHRHLPWVAGISGPPAEFNSADAAARVGQIAFKHALELEHRPASAETTMALRNSMLTIEKADVIMRRSDVALKDVLKQFQKFRMRVDDAQIIPVHTLSAGNYSKSGEGTDAEGEDDDF
jgi:hypothetical protein